MPEPETLEQIRKRIGQYGKPDRWGRHGSKEDKAAFDEQRMGWILEALKQGATPQEVSSVQKDPKGQDMLRRALAMREISPSSGGL